MRPVRPPGVPLVKVGFQPALTQTTHAASLR